ncbi:MAG: hypothetical protein A2Y62_13650 [Candidatus Fischerbacteria bacterium RBG_13_37_8]|uniref:Sulfatase N-terminal domain-containing protein n=1 Tax=Candidatus Fischerbacteria bacterium RBG_13_37_8 TaxID=1817863 RepID=A0A1F5V7Q2_9BACT|nr:MAG: hypothetical protein A2Y62_13650 [Candidatus Fischerbacteria bacterium RBG_13_37_8]
MIHSDNIKKSNKNILFSNKILLLVSFAIIIICLGIIYYYVQKPHLIIDLVQHKLAADAVNQAFLIDFGSSTSITKTMLKDGWSINESTGNINFVWASSLNSYVDFFLIRIENQPIEFRIMPFQIPNSKPQSMTIFLNDAIVDTIVLRSGWNTYKTILPIEKLRLGNNQLKFSFLYAEPPVKYNIGNDTRNLAAAFDYIKFNAYTIQKDNEHELFTMPGQEPLVLNGLTAFRYHLVLPQKAKLRIKGTLFPSQNNEALPSLTIWIDNNNSIQLLFDSQFKIATPYSFNEMIKIPDLPNGIIQLYIANSSVRQNTRFAFQSITIEGNRKAQSHTKKLPNAIIILMDALRPDHLSAYQYHRKTSPHLDRLAQEGTVFFNAFTQSSYTREAVPSLLSALYTLTHNVTNFNQMPPDIITLPELLSAHGYATAAFTANGLLSPESGILQGFNAIYELYRTAPFGPENITLAESFIPALDEWLIKNSHKPFFAYLHLMQPHEPYKAPEPFRIFSRNDKKSIFDGSANVRGRVKENRIPITPNDLQHMINLYDDSIYYADYVVGKILHKLALLQLYDDTMIIIIADHGEEFMEHGDFSHSQHLYDECLRVPLIIKMPASLNQRKKVMSLVEVIDVAPTTLQTLGINEPLGQGKSLVPLITARNPEQEIHHAVFAARRTFASIRTHRFKYIEMSDKSSIQLFDLKKDPHEQKNSAQEYPEYIKIFSEYLNKWKEQQQAFKPGEPTAIDQQTLENLRALGYIE